MKPLLRSSNAGFTLIELIVVMVMAAVLAAIAAPSWLAFLNKQRLNTAQAEAVSAMREAQAKAKQQKRAWEVCFQDDATVGVRWFVRPVPGGVSNCATNPGPWNNMIGSDSNKIAIDTGNSTLNGGYHRVAFQYNGWVDVPPPTNIDAEIGKITLITRNQTGGSRRCVYVATLLGAIRTGSDTECNN